MVDLNKLGAVVPADILVIGGGISGVVAAIKARQSGASVVLADKATVGWAGQVPVAGGAITILPPDEDLDEFVKYVVKEGDYLNDQNWTYHMATCWFDSIKEIFDWGAPIKKQSDGRMEIIWRPFSSRKTRFVMFDTHKMMPILRSRARSAGVKLLNKTEVTRLLTTGGSVAGAAGFNIVSGEFVVMPARVTILATAGGYFKIHRLWQASCGEGVAMAYHAGAEFSGTEFGTYDLPCIKDYDSFARNIVVRNFHNNTGENISDRYMPEAGGENWLPLVRGMVTELREGRGPLWLDLSRATPEMKSVVRPANPTKHSFWHICDVVGLDPFGQRIEVMPKGNINVSSIKVDRDCRTTVPGLWSCGEACGQGSRWCGATHSAGQYPGWGIAQAIITGRLAGESAARSAPDVRQPTPDPVEIERLRGETFAPLYLQAGTLPDDYIYQVQEIVMPLKNTLVRQKDRLEDALTAVKGLQPQAASLRARDMHDLVKCHEAQSMTLMAEMVFRSAVMRTESRGTHFREDFPKRDDKNWLKWITLKKEKGQMSLRTEPVPIDRYRFRP
ncbi:MAG: FAD-binding protein [Chloroflexi bacterium]|nr:FAD-binding protein [Chloroflexota bacterium]